MLIKVVAEMSRLLLGLAFAFSGIVKAIDPLGTAYKIQDYLTAMGATWLHKVSLPASVLLCSVEFWLGICLLLGIYRRFTGRLLLVVMLVMTPLTLYLALFNPVSDCGCFGDALIISNWQTFGKNVVLLAASLVLWRWHQRITPFYTHHIYWLVGLWTMTFVLLFSGANYLLLPAFDFRPYKETADLRQMVAQKSESDTYRNILIYQKDGKKQAFTEENYPWQDSTWTFVEMKSELVSQGQKSPVADFDVQRYILSSDRKKVTRKEEFTQPLLSDTGYTFLMVAYALPEMSEIRRIGFEDISYYAQEQGHKFFCLTASPEQDILQFVEHTGVNYDFCQADERVLKTMIRSNPGLILLKDGKIVRKWSNLQIPSEKDLVAGWEKHLPYTPSHKKTEYTDRIMLLCLIFVLPLLALLAISLLFYKLPYWVRLRLSAPKHLSPQEQTKEAKQQEENVVL